jgi:hypothetical protein
MNQRVPSPTPLFSIPSDYPLTHDKFNGFCSPKSTKRVGRRAWCCAPARAARATITGWGISAALIYHSREGSIKAMCLLSSPSFTRPSFPTGIRDGGLQEPRAPRLCSLGRKNACHGLAALGIPQEVQESPVRGSNGGALGCTSRQRNTHNIESREVRYPWHPWHARAVAVHGALTKNGRGVFRCGIDENPGVRLLEIPQWMFDSVDCCRMRLATVPTVSGAALLDLKALLRCASFPVSDVVLQSQHRALLSPGDVDAKITKPTESRSIQTISSTPEAPVLAGAACRNQTENSTVAGATSARAHRKSRTVRAYWPLESG